MHFLLDMGISNIVDVWLTNHGHNSSHIRDNGLHSLEDILIIDKSFKRKPYHYDIGHGFRAIICRYQIG